MSLDDIEKQLNLISKSYENKIAIIKQENERLKTEIADLKDTKPVKKIVESDDDIEDMKDLIKKLKKSMYSAFNIINNLFENDMIDDDYVCRGDLKKVLNLLDVDSYE